MIEQRVKRFSMMVIHCSSLPISLRHACSAKLAAQASFGAAKLCRQLLSLRVGRTAPDLAVLEISRTRVLPMTGYPPLAIILGRLRQATTSL